jgi:CDP-diacylglycerol pyrophosphatase
MMLSKRLGWIAALVLVVLVAAGVSTIVRTLASPNALWTLVQGCVAQQKQGHVPPGECASVDLDDKVAILRSLEGRYQYLAIPTIRVTGIEDPQLENRYLPNYWALAWSAAYRYLPARVTKDRTNIGLAINSIPGRSQNQLHIHISCIQPYVRDLLLADQSEISTTWSRPFLKVGGREYRAMRVQSPTLAATNPFLLLLRLPGAAQHMGLHTLVVTGASWDTGRTLGFYILDDYAHHTPDGPDDGHGEGLLDENCLGFTEH